MNPIDYIIGAAKCSGVETGAVEAVSPDEATVRLAICSRCPQVKHSRLMGMDIDRCSVCECVLSIAGVPRCKTKVLGESCPEGRW